MRRLIAIFLFFTLCAGCLAASGEGDPFFLIVEYGKKDYTGRMYYADKSGNRVTGPEGYCEVECQYPDGAELPYKVRYLNTEGKRVLNGDGYSVIRIIYDSWMRLAPAPFDTP